VACRRAVADPPAPPSERVLCSGEHYTLGRNAEEAQLVVPILRVSRVAGTFSLGSVSVDAVGDPGVRARITWTMHAASKSGAHAETFRGRNRVEQRVRPEEPLELGDGARIRLTSRYFAELRWLPLVVGVMRVPQLEAPDVRTRAAALGVHLVPSRRQLDARCTHLCVASARPSKTQLLALIRGLRVVDAAFVQQVLHLDRSSPLELPEAEAHVPPSDAALPPEAQMDRACLAPDTRRAALFRGATLLLIVPQLDRRYVRVCEKGAADLAAGPCRARRGGASAGASARCALAPNQLARRGERAAQGRAGRRRGALDTARKARHGATARSRGALFRGRRRDYVGRCSPQRSRYARRRAGSARGGGHHRMRAPRAPVWRRVPVGRIARRWCRRCTSRIARGHARRQLSDGASPERSSTGISRSSHRGAAHERRSGGRITP